MAEADAEREHRGGHGRLQARFRRQLEQLHRPAVRRPRRPLQLVQPVQQLGGQSALASEQQKLPLGEHPGLGGSDGVAPPSSHPSQPRQLFQRRGDVRGREPHGRDVRVGWPGGHLHASWNGLRAGGGRFTGRGDGSRVSLRGTRRAAPPLRAVSVHSAPQNSGSPGELYRDDVEQHRLPSTEGEAAQQRLQPERELVRHGQHPGLGGWQPRRLEGSVRGRRPSVGVSIRADHGWRGEPSLAEQRGGPRERDGQGPGLR